MTGKSSGRASPENRLLVHGTLRASWAAVLLATIALLAYSNTFQAGLAQDSKGRILKDPRIQSVTASHLQQIVSEDYWWPIHESGLYRPLTTLSYLLNYSVLGNQDRPAGYHGVNLALHWLNGLLVFLLVRAFTKAPWPAFLAAALFTVHPVATETVTNIVGRADLLAATSVLGGFLVYRRARCALAQGSWRWWAGLSTIYLLGLFSKEVAVVLPGILILYEIALRLPGGSEAGSGGVSLAGLVRRGGVSMALPLAGWVAARTRVLGGVLTAEIPFVDNPLIRSGFWESRATAVQIMGDYLRLLIWPVGLSNDYSFDQVPVLSFSQGGWGNWEWLLSALVIAGLVALAVLFRRKSVAFFFFVFFAMISILPVCNLVVLIGSIRADRFLYLPSIGFVTCLVLLVLGAGRFLGARISAGNRRVETCATLILAIVVLGYGGLTWARNQDWRSDLHLWSRGVETSPDSFRTHHALAFLLYQEDPQNRNLDQVIEREERAASILVAASLPMADLPVGVPAQLGAYYLLKGEQVAAAGSMGDESRDPAFWRHKAVEQLLLASRADQAANQRLQERRLARGREPQPDAGQHDVYFNLGLARERLGELPEALEAYAYLRHLDPARADYSWNIASVQLAQSNLEEAAVSLHQVLLLAPNAGDIPPYLRDAYASIDPEGCAWSPTGFDVTCPMVHEDLCDALEGLDQVHRHAGRTEQADRWRRQALEQHGCADLNYLD